MNTRRRVTFEVPDKARIPEVQGATQRVLDEHAIVHNVGGSGQVLVLTVEFGNAAEIEPLTKAAHLEALHITPVEMRVT